MFLQTYMSSHVLLGDAFGISYPDAFTHPLIEYRALTTRAALIDLTHQTVLRLRGDDRVRFLNNMTTNDVAALTAGHGCHSALTTVKGKLVAELFVLARDEELVVIVAQGEGQAVIDTLDKHIIADDVTVENATAGVLSLEGPLCREVVWRLFPDAPIPLEPLSFVDVDYQGITVTLFRNGVTGEKGFQLIVPAAGIERIRDYLVQSGRGDDMELCGRAAWNMRRIENGLPWWNVDVGDNFPKESRLDHLVSYTKGCYLGQETLARMHHRGHPNWLLVGLRSSQMALPDFFDMMDEDLVTVEEDPDTVRYHVDVLSLVDMVDAGTELFPGSDASAGEEKAAGRLTSLTFSPRTGGALFMGYVRAPLAQTGNEFIFSTGDEVTRTTVTTLPIEESK